MGESYCDLCFDDLVQEGLYEVYKPDGTPRFCGDCRYVVCNECEDDERFRGLVSYPAENKQRCTECHTKFQARTRKMRQREAPGQTSNRARTYRTTDRQRRDAERIARERRDMENRLRTEQAKQAEVAARNHLADSHIVQNTGRNY